MALSPRTSSAADIAARHRRAIGPEHEPALIERQNDEDRTYRVSYGELFAPIVNSIQQQQREITQVRQQNADLRRALEDQAAAFKAENDALRRAIEALREQLTAAR